MTRPHLPHVGPFRGDDGRPRYGRGVYIVTDVLTLVPDLIAEDCVFLFVQVGSRTPMVDLNPHAGAGRGHKRPLEDFLPVVESGKLPNNVELRRCTFMEVPPPEQPLRASLRGSASVRALTIGMQQKEVA